MEQSNSGVAARTRLRHRRIAIALSLAVAIGVPAVYFVPLALQYAEGPSAEAAIEWARQTDYTYSFESQYVDDQGRTVYRLVSNTDPAIVNEMRYGFRWFPRVRISPSVAPSLYVDDAGSYYELVNEEEWRRTYLEWDREQYRREQRTQS